MKSLSLEACLSLVCCLGLYFVSSPVLAQSWSAWKQIAEEQSKGGKLAEAEESWRAAYELLLRSKASDARLYITAWKLTGVLIAEKKTDEAQKVLSAVCSEQYIKADTAAAEKLACLQRYAELCRSKNNKGEESRVKALIDQLSAGRASGASSESGKSEPQVSIFFGNAARDVLFKKFGEIKQLTAKKDYARAESELKSALSMANASHDRELTSLVLREQGKFFCISKDFNKAEAVYAELADMIKQASGSESMEYAEVLGTHARLLQSLGKIEAANAEKAKCEAIASKCKLTPTSPQELSAFKNDKRSLFNSKNGQAPSGLTQAAVAGKGNNPQLIASAAQVPPRSPYSTGSRLKVIEFFTTW